MKPLLRLFRAFREMEASVLSARQEAADWRLLWESERAQVASLTAANERIYEQFTDAVFVRFLGRTVFSKTLAGAPVSIDDTPKKAKEEPKGAALIAKQKTVEFMKQAEARLSELNKPKAS